MSVNDSILYLSRADVAAACREVDTVTAVREVLALHPQGEVAVPGEAYLAWQTPDGAAARSLNMPGYLGAALRRPGTKIINASLRNTGNGLPRASGLTLLFDVDSARIVCILEGAYISALRTAGVTIVAAEELAAGPPRRAAVIGAGVLGRTHTELMVERLAELEAIDVFDVAEDRAERLCSALAVAAADRGVRLRAAGSAQEAIAGADLVVTATTTRSGYVRQSWLAPGTLVVNVSLDDVLPEVVLGADHLIVDDWALVRDDPHRLLGRMVREGKIVGPGERAGNGSARAVDATLGQVVSGRYRRPRRPDDVVLVNPFGMAIEDIVVAHYVHEVARRRGLGQELPR